MDQVNLAAVAAAGGPAADMIDKGAVPVTPAVGAAGPSHASSDVVATPVSSKADTAVAGPSTAQANSTTTSTNTAAPTSPGAVHKPGVAAGSIQGAGQVFGTVNLYNSDASRSAAPTPWEDELIAVPQLPDPSDEVPAEDVDRWAAELLSRRLLLVRHAPHRQKEAVAAMRAVLHRVAQREPRPPVFNSGFDSALQLHSLCRPADWREDRRNSIIYLYRSTDPAALSFFNNIEQVGALCHKLTQMGSHLLLTAVLPATAELRDEAELARRIAVWRFDEERPSASPELPKTFTGLFEVKLAVCAAIFPGLRVDEFVALANTLAPPPEPRPAALASAGEASTPAKDEKPAPLTVPVLPEPPTRHERWSKGDRDSVLAELGIQLCSSPHGEGAEVKAGEPGMFFTDPVLRAEMPAWLYSRYPILLSQQLDVMTRHYLDPGASQRFRTGYRRLVLRMDAIGAQRLTAEWLLRHFLTGLDSNPRLLAQRFAELLAEVPEHAEEVPLVTAFIEGIAAQLHECEAALIRHLDRDDQLKLAAQSNWSPYRTDFWTTMFKQPAACNGIQRTVLRQAVVIDLLLALAARAPVCVAHAIGGALSDSNAAHEDWLRTAGLLQAHRPIVSLARVACRDMQGQLLGQSPTQWLAFAEGVIQSYAPTGEDQVRRARTARWLAWDCIHAFASMFDDASGALASNVMRAALTNGKSARQMGEVLAALLRMAAPPHWLNLDGAWQPEPYVDIGSMLWLYQSLAQVVMAQENAAATQAATVADIVGPWRDGLRPPQRLDVIDVACNGLDEAFADRDTLPARTPRDRLAEARREHTQRIQALQSVLRILRQSPARGDARHQQQPATRRA